MKNICFTGHRQIRNDSRLIARLEETLRNLIEQHGATDFYSGGAIGWDTLCAETVLKLRSTYPHIRLHLVSPAVKLNRQLRGTVFRRKPITRYFLPQTAWNLFQSTIMTAV